MRIFRDSLEREASATGFRAEILEKVIHLFSLLDGFQKHPFLRGKWALKGGTALNLFWFDMPRLSVDIDLMPVCCRSESRGLEPPSESEGTGSASASERISTGSFFERAARRFQFFPFKAANCPCSPRYADRSISEPMRAAPAASQRTLRSVIILN